MSAKTLVVLNPAARRGAAGKTFPQVKAALEAAGLVFDFVETHTALHAVRLAWEAPLNGYEQIIAVGGDGLVHEVVNGLMRASNEGETIPLGVIPLGTGNDFVKALPPPLSPGEHRDDWVKALPRVTRGVTALLDVGRIVGDVPAPGHPHPQYFANGMDVGFGARVAREIHKAPFHMTGLPAYLFGVFTVLMNYRSLRVKVTLDDGEVIERESTMSAVANGRCFGSSFWLTPFAMPDDGILDVIISKQLGRVGILQIIPLILKGKHLNHWAVTSRRARKIIIESSEPLTVEADGELPFLEARRLEIEILPARLRLMV